MKKLIYAVLVAMITSIAISSCTDEEVNPKPFVDAPGGSGSTDHI